MRIESRNRIGDMHRCMARARTEKELSVAMSEHWDDVRFFLAALRHGSFTRAAAALKTDQSTVSRRIAALEVSLGVVLFDRGHRAPTPTEAAARLRESAERIEAEMGRFADDAVGIRSQAVEGRVRLALTEELAIHFIIPTVLPALRAAHPNLSLDLLTGYGAADLASREADVALRFFQTERGDLVGRRIARMPTCVLASRAYAKKVKGKPLTDLDWISVELAGLATPESAWFTRRIRKPPVLLCSSYQVQIAAIRSGLGVGIGPVAFTEIDRAFVALEDTEGALPTLDLHLVTRRSIRSLPRIEVVLAALTAAFEAATSAPGRSSEKAGPGRGRRRAPRR